VPGRLHHATLGRFFAATYDRVMARAEERGLRAQRAELLAQARGATLELGAGTGLNLAHYPPAVTELVLSEPDEFMGARLRRRVAASGRATEVVVAPGERLPFPDERFDTVAATPPLEVALVERRTLPAAPPIVRPTIVGRAVRPAAG
jgi:ubiquinone/menaquinone biosynthesis C-methylase UbiE